MTKKGWPREPARHSLAARGRKTKRFNLPRKLPTAIPGRNSAREYVEAIRKIMGGNSNAADFYDFVLTNGRGFRAPPLPSKLPAGVRSCDYKTKECFYNAQMVALLRGWDYYEGFATSIIPTEHAWVITPGRELLDLTWDKVAEPGEEFDYFGVRVPNEFILEHIEETGQSDSMLVKWWEHQTGRRRR